MKSFTNEGKPLLKDNPFLNPTQLNMERLADLNRESKGSKYLWDNYPHLMERLQKDTLHWLLIPKYIFASKEVLKEKIPIFRENIAFLATSNQLPVSSHKQQMEIMNTVPDILDFIEEKILPKLPTREDLGYEKEQGDE